MSKFKVGDRVKVYDGYYKRGGVGKVEKVEAGPLGNGAVHFQMDDGWACYINLDGLYGDTIEHVDTPAANDNEPTNHTADAPGPGRKDDSAKLRVDLIPPLALVKIALLYDEHQEAIDSCLDKPGIAIAALANWRARREASDLVNAAIKLFDELDSTPDVLFTRGGIEGVAKVLAFGAAKYGEWNWERVEDGERRYYAAAIRHIAAHNGGELNDPESGLPHLAHALTSIMFLIHIVEVAK